MSGGCRIRAGVAVAALAVVSTACGPPSEVARDADVEIVGQVVGQDGAAVPGAPVVLVKEVGPAEFLSGGLTVMTWGFACLYDPDLEPCGEFTHHAEAGDDGAYRFSVRGADVQSGFGTASTMSVTAARPAAEGRPGPATTIRLHVQSEALQLPAAQLWEPSVEVALADGLLTVDWPALPSSYGEADTHGALFLDADGLPVWHQDEPGVPLDARVLEDHAVTVVVEVVSTPDDGWERIYRSAQQPVSSPGPPPSRGADCLLPSPGAEPVRISPCPLTDGDLTTELDPHAEGHPCPRGGMETCPPEDLGLVVELPTEGPRQLVAVRGEEDEVVVHTSLDGVAWSGPTAVALEEGRGAATLPSGQPLRYVRVQTVGGGAPSLTEVSVW